MARLLSVNVGLPREIHWRGQTVRTAIWKNPVQGKRLVRRLNIEGDGQGDLAGHGGEHRAVFVYQIDSCRYWQNQLHRTDFTFGQFGENFTIEGLPDTEVCIGDHYRIGGALFEVTQPRVTCYRVGIRMDEPRMAALLVAHGRPGFYFRVLEEGEVEAGEEIVKVLAGPEGMSVAEINQLLYLPGHPRQQLERALRIPALSPGWRSSFQALLQQELSGGNVTGNPGLTSAGGPAPAWPGFRPLRVSRVEPESHNVFSLELTATDGSPLAMALPGQFVVLRLRTQREDPPLLRNYSLCGPPSTERYRLGIKKETGGVASNYLAGRVSVGDILEVSAPRGSFVLQPGDRPIVLISAGIGVTPVLAMLYALASGPTDRQVWWLHGARSGNEHPFAEEARRLIQSIPHARSCVQYSQPGREDLPGLRFDALGHLAVSSLKRLGVRQDSDFYLCGPPAFLRGFTADLAAWAVAPQRVHTEIFGPGEARSPGIVQASVRPPHPPAGVPGPGPRVSFARSGLAVNWDPAFHSLLELAEACDVPVQWSCRTGVCHNCEKGLVAGAVHYDPEPIEPPAEGNLLTCCSRPQGDVILDL
ncbi:MAG TPA: MOSC and FAD-binding oxidoreductase domain-containing protein [Candidatus Acidoferrales bacterium]|nr:MOSC and FAD-binding oxidoreductase domain-containing protein [Candidatus Acidoferrales bacterium]